MASSAKMSTRLLSYLRWPAASLMSYHAAVFIEPETGMSFDDELMVTVYPGLKKRYRHSLQRLCYPLAQPHFTFLSKLKYKYWLRPFAMAQYSSSTVTVYRMVLLRAFGGAELMPLIKAEMLKCSQSGHEVDVDCTRTGSLFFAAVGKLKEDKGAEIIFLCNRETDNFTIWTRHKDQDDFHMHFTIESTLLIECIYAAFGRDTSQCFQVTQTLPHD